MAAWGAVSSLKLCRVPPTACIGTRGMNKQQESMSAQGGHQKSPSATAAPPTTTPSATTTTPSATTTTCVNRVTNRAVGPVLARELGGSIDLATAVLDACDKTTDPRSKLKALLCVHPMLLATPSRQLHLCIAQHVLAFECIHFIPVTANCNSTARQWCSACQVVDL